MRFLFYIDLLTDVEELIKNAIEDEPPFTLREGGMIKKGYNEEIVIPASATLILSLFIGLSESSPIAFCLLVIF